MASGDTTKGNVTFVFICDLGEKYDSVVDELILILNQQWPKTRSYWERFIGALSTPKNLRGGVTITLHESHSATKNKVTGTSKSSKTLKTFQKFTTLGSPKFFLVYFALDLHQNPSLGIRGSLSNRVWNFGRKGMIQLLCRVSCPKKFFANTFEFRISNAEVLHFPTFLLLLLSKQFGVARFGEILN